ncbi:MAG: glucose-6-phosphate isomerase [Rickettsiella sp.]|nr:glucose-6-phosphate isomerase [Rickettsiella sp.]
MTGLTEAPEWEALQLHASEINKTSIAKLFATDPNRFKKFSLTENTLTLDYSKNPITEKTLDLLCRLADRLQLKQHILDLFTGKCVNTTQKLPALHTALRDPKQSGLIVNGTDVLIAIHTALDKMEKFIEQIKTNNWRGMKQPITDVVNLGIGGSDLGPLMAVESLKAYQCTQLHLHFISNVDNNALEHLLKQLNPETTLFIIASKSFSTLETLINAKTIWHWMLKKIPNSKVVPQHFLAVTAHAEKAIEFGISEENIFPLWDWIGGRFSLCSCIGLSVALAIGIKNFREILHGAHIMDQHFLNTPWPKNIPIMLGLLGIWQRNFFQSEAHVILPYDAALKYLPAYLQQLEMESNGKSIRIDNKKVDYATCPVIFGEVGLNGQHAFYQLFHQGTAHFSADFILTLRNPHHELQNHHQHVIASALSQSKALMEGHHCDIAYKTLPGNHSSNMLTVEELTPFSLGMLVALYEHKVFVQSVIWQINPFDQWGVEYGKQLSQSIFNVLNKTSEKKNQPTFDSSTQGLIASYQRVNTTNAK